ncbi:MAG: hypothetical protein ABIO70_00680 [Pseudomonadota bacterium]
MRFRVVALAVALSGCTRYALRSEADRYVPPAGLAERAAQAGDRPVVLLVPGSMIVGDFYDQLVPWLETQGFWPLVYTAPDLIAGPLRDAAPLMAEAIQVSAQASGQARIHVIAECDGGIATRYAVEKLGADRHVDRFVSFVSAHGGTRGFPITWFPALRDIQPDSNLVWEMAHSRLPRGSGTTAYTLSFCEDEVMKPTTTSAYAGAVNIALCDPGVTQRARERTPPNVHHRLGQAMIPMYRQHFAGFWDEEVFLLYRLLLTGEVDDVLAYDRLQLTVSDDR